MPDDHHNYGILHNPGDVDDEWSEWFPSLDEANAAARQNAEYGGRSFYLIKRLKYDADKTRNTYLTQTCKGCQHPRSDHARDYSDCTHRDCQCEWFV